MAPNEWIKKFSWLYHFTDQKNLISIKKHGLYSTAKLRKMKIEPVFGGNDHSLEADEMFGMDKFVHLSFTQGHPMAHLAQKDGRIKKLEWLHIDAAEIFKFEGVLFCPGVANKSGMKTFSLKEAEAQIDFGAFGYLDWKIPENQQRRATVDKYEILVPDHIPFSLFKKKFPNG